MGSLLRELALEYSLLNLLITCLIPQRSSSSYKKNKDNKIEKNINEREITTRKNMLQNKVFVMTCSVTAASP